MIFKETVDGGSKPESDRKTLRLESLEEYPKGALWSTSALVGTIDGKKVETLRSFEEIEMPFGLIYIDPADGVGEQRD